MGKPAAGRGRTVLQAGEETASALRERVKELSCLYRINRIFDGFPWSLDEVLQCIAELIPPAWQYPEITSACIVFDGRRYTTTGFEAGRQRQAANVVVEGKCRGLVEVVYREDRPELDEGPFLRDERDLLDAIARQIAVIVEHHEAAEERVRLHRQLMHADRRPGVRAELMSVPDRKETILIVDDTPSTLEVLQRGLTAEGYTTYAAPNAVDALHLLEGTFVDLVITDLKMPKISGIDLIRHVRENYRNTAVMMITGYATVESAVEAVKSGAEEYVPKPFVSVNCGGIPESLLESELFGYVKEAFTGPDGSCITKEEVDSR